MSKDQHESWYGWSWWSQAEQEMHLERYSGPDQVDLQSLAGNFYFNKKIENHLKILNSFPLHKVTPTAGLEN